MIAAVLHLDKGARRGRRKPATICGAVSRTAMMSLTTFRERVRTLCGELGRRCGVELLRIADNVVGFDHLGESLRLGLRRAAGDDDLSPAGARGAALRIACRACRTASAVTAQVLTMIASSSPALSGFAADHLALGGVQPAAEGDDLDAHSTLVAGGRRTAPRRTGPRTRTRLGRSSAHDRRSRAIRCKIAAGKLTVTFRPVRPSPGGRDRRGAGRRAAGPGETGATLPGADADVIARRWWRA